MIPKFKSYATNIRRTRHNIKVRKQHPQSYIQKQSIKSTSPAQPQSQPQLQPQVQVQVHTQVHTQPHAATSSIRSLLYTLQQETNAIMRMAKVNHHLPIILTTTDVNAMRDAINHALIQAIRASSDQGDYIMIRNIVHAAVEYSHAFGTVYSSFKSRGEGNVSTSDSDGDGESGRDSENENGMHVRPVPLLEARLFGEAIGEMGTTNAGHGKLKKIWVTFMELAAGCRSDSDIDSASTIDSYESTCGLASDASAFELNAMIGALAKRGKVRAALKIYQAATDGTGKHSVKIAGDAYTASALLTMLAKSIEADDGPRSHSNVDGKGKSRALVSLSSPCWQWNEAISIMDDFEKRVELNNQVYAAALKVNEQAMILYRFPGNKHPGAKCAMSILERMQVRLLV
jgi:hypothetical protein